MFDGFTDVSITAIPAAFPDGSLTATPRTGPVGPVDECFRGQWAWAQCWKAGTGRYHQAVRLSSRLPFQLFQPAMAQA